MVFAHSFQAAGPSYLPCHHSKFSTTYADLCLRVGTRSPLIEINIQRLNIKAMALASPSLFMSPLACQI